MPVKQATARTIIRAVEKALIAGMTALRDKIHARFKTVEDRLAALEEKAGIRSKAATASDYKAGDVVDWGTGGKWICRGAGRWRKVEDNSHVG